MTSLDGRRFTALENSASGQVGLDTDAVTSSGRCHSRIEDGPRLLLHETWQWESKPGAGTSVLAEVTDQA